MTPSELYESVGERLVRDAKPSEYLNALGEPAFGEYPFTMVSGLKKVEQSPVYHPEGSVWNHTMRVVDRAAAVKAQASEPRVFMWAALLHDIGKAAATRVRNGRITAYDHDRKGAVMAAEFLRFFREDGAFVRQVRALVRWHMQVLYSEKRLPFFDLEGLKREAPVGDVALLGLCDRLGRGNADPGRAREAVRRFLERAGDGSIHI